MTSSPKMKTTPPLTPDEDLLGCSGDLSDAIVAVLNAYPTPLGCLAPQQMLSGQASIEVMRALNVCYQNWKRKWKVERAAPTAAP
jgi:hypothetical protein